MDLQSLTKNALSLSEAERGLLAARLLESLESAEGNSLDAWLDVAEERIRELDEGRIQTISGSEVERRVRSRIS